MKIIGDVKISPEVLNTLRTRGKSWAVFQCHAMDSSQCGELRFLQFGEGCTFTTAPAKMPDSHLGTGWAWLFVGIVDLPSGDILEINEKSGEIIERSKEAGA